MPIDINAELEPKPLQLHSPDELAAWLGNHSIDTSRWGYGAAKSIDNLWEELVCGEMRLQENPVMRIVPVVQVIIRQGNAILIESIQEFADQRRRLRRHPPSEKMKPDENYIGAAARCLQEELGLDVEEIEILTATYRQRQEELESPSYPGLWTRYVFHVVEAKVKNLPSTDFWTNEAEHNEIDAVKRHYWTWQEVDSQIFG